MSSAPTHVRDRVSRIAASDPAKARKIARGIDDPWFRCQALAIAARHSAELGHRNRLLKESFAAALQTGEPNRVVTVSAWPLRVLCRSGQLGDLHREVLRLLETIGREPSPVRRADALETMLRAVADGPRPLFWKVHDEFEQACPSRLASGKRNSKGESRLISWLPIVRHFDPERAERIVERLRGLALRQRAIAVLEERSHIVLAKWVQWPGLD